MLGEGRAAGTEGYSFYFHLLICVLSSAVLIYSLVLRAWRLSEPLGMAKYYGCLRATTFVATI